MVGVMCDRGHANEGVVHGRKCQLASRQYASYWNDVLVSNVMS